MEQDTAKAVVLLVDDAPTVRMLVSNLLRKEGFTPQMAVNGKEAVEMAEELQPNIILMDINMPVMNGFEACEILKSNAATKNIPVIFMTALDQDADRVKGFDVGGEDYIIKPVNYKELLARTRRFLERDKSETASTSLAHSLDDCLHIAEELEKLVMPDDAKEKACRLASNLRAAACPV